MRFDVARSTIQGNAKASISGTSDGEIPRLPFNLKCACFYGNFRSGQERIGMDTLEQAKVKVEELMNKEHKLSFESEELFGVVLNYLFVSVASKEDMQATFQKLQELLKPVGEDENLAQQIREAYRVIKYLDDNEHLDYWKVWSE